MKDSPCQFYRKRAKDSVENMYTDITLRVNQNVTEIGICRLVIKNIMHTE